MANDKLVCKANSLVEMKINKLMSYNELRLFAIYVSRINPMDEEINVEFTVKEYANILGVQPKNVYSDLKKINLENAQKVIQIETEHGHKTMPLYGMIEYIDYENQRKIVISSSNAIKPYLLDLKEKMYTKYYLWNILGLSSAHAIRMYEILKQYEKKGWRIVQLETLRGYLGIESNQYKEFKIFNRDIVKKTQEALKNNTDIKFTYETIKTGKKVTAIKFYIAANNEYASQTVLDEYAAASDDGMIFNIDKQEYEVSPIVYIMELFKGRINKSQAEDIYHLAMELYKFEENATEKVKETALLFFSSGTHIKHPKAWICKALKENWSDPEDVRAV